MGVAPVPEARRLFHSMTVRENLLLDEPSMGLSPALVDKVYEIIEGIAAAGTTMFIVEQNATMALSVANRGYVLQNGHIVISDSADAILESERIRTTYLGEA